MNYKSGYLSKSQMCQNLRSRNNYQKTSNLNQKTLISNLGLKILMMIKW